MTQNLISLPPRKRNYKMSKGYPFLIPNYSMNLLRQRTTLYKFLAGTRNWVMFLTFICWVLEKLIGCKNRKETDSILDIKARPKTRGTKVNSHSLTWYNYNNVKTKRGTHWEKTPPSQNQTQSLKIGGTTKKTKEQLQQHTSDTYIINRLSFMPI